MIVLPFPKRRSHPRRRRAPFQAGLRQHWIVVGIAIVAVIAFQLDAPHQETDMTVTAAIAPDTVSPAPFRLCRSGERHHCVVDGDTIWLDGENIRIADIDTPEVFSPACPAERLKGVEATRRMMALLNAGAFEVRRIDRETDRYGRKLRTLYRNGQSLGARLVAEGLAEEWGGRRIAWCA